MRNDMLHEIQALRMNLAIENRMVQHNDALEVFELVGGNIYKEICHQEQEKNRTESGPEGNEKPDWPRTLG